LGFEAVNRTNQFISPLTETWMPSCSTPVVGLAQRKNALRSQTGALMIRVVASKTPLPGF
jgi:hypothetical protein